MIEFYHNKLQIATLNNKFKLNGFFKSKKQLKERIKFSMTIYYISIFHEINQNKNKESSIEWFGINYFCNSNIILLA